MRRKLLIIAGLSLPGIALWVYTSAQFIIWDGSFDLTIHVSSDTGQPRSVTCEAFGRHENAETVFESLIPPETRMWSVTADPFDCRPLTVTVPVSGRQSMSGRQLRRTQFQFLVVIAVLPDGRRVGTIVDIPDNRVSREVTVRLP